VNRCFYILAMVTVEVMILPLMKEIGPIERLFAGA
jgi:hypothetical protein